MVHQFELIVDIILELTKLLLKLKIQPLSVPIAVDKVQILAMRALHIIL